MPKLDTFPNLEFEGETDYKKEIEDLFDKIKHLNLAFKAKEILYPLRENYRALFIGGGANHIWFHHKKDGEMSDDRVAIIHFDPYFNV